MEGAIKNGHSRETDNNTKKNKTHYVLDTTIRKQTTGGKDEPNIVFMRKS
jgi:hypothetical protein